MDCSPPGSPVHGIFQARVLEWGAIAFSGRDPQTEEIGCKCQTFFLSLLSSRRKQTTSVRFFFLLHTKLKGGFSTEMFFLSYVSETMYLLWNLPFFKMVPPKTNFFPFLKSWADNSSTNQYSYHLFYGWEMTHFLPS